jgi:hypothetical protein
MLPVGQTTLMIGKTNRKIFWIVFGISLFFLGLLGALASQGAIALAAALPVPFTVQAQSINATSFHLYPGISQADNSSPTGVTQMDCTISHLTVSKQIQLPIVGTFTFSITSGQTTPATLRGLTIDVSSLNVNQATFQNIVFNTATNNLNVTAPAGTLDGATISSPYLLVNSITLPGLSLSVTHS